MDRKKDFGLRSFIGLVAISVAVVGTVAVAVVVAVFSRPSVVSDTESIARPLNSRIGAAASALAEISRLDSSVGAEAQDIRTLDSEIESLEQEIQARQVQIERENVVKTLNENRLNDYERKLLFELLNTQASARTRQIELRMKRLRLLVEQGSES